MLEPDAGRLGGRMAEREFEEFEEFYAGNYGRFVVQVYAVTGSLAEAEDAVQEAFARASVRWRWLSAYDAPDAWVRWVAFNVARNSLRRARSRLRAAERLPPPAAAPAPTADLLDDRQQRRRRSRMDA